MGRGVNIEDDQLVRFFLVKNLDRVDRIADVFWLRELNSFYQAAVLDQQAWRYARS